MGIKERFDLPSKAKSISKFRAKLNLGISIFKIYRQLRRLPKERRLFLLFLEKTMNEYEAIDLSNQTATQLMGLYKRFEEVLLEQWKPPLVNDFFAMIYFGTLEKLSIKYELGANIHNDLLCGSQDIISTEPVTRILSISSTIQEDEATKKFFTENDATYIWKNLSKHVKASDEINSYLKKFGERCVGELKLETESYNQCPENLIAIIKSYVEQGIVSRNNNQNLESELRKNGELKLEEKIKSPFKKLLFNYILNKTRDLVSNRENLRFERTRGFGMVRKIFSAIGDQFYAENIIDNNRDIFYLTKEEIFDYIQGTAVTKELKALIVLRKNEFDKYHLMEVPSERIPTYGPVYHANDFFAKGKEEEFEGDMKGIGACPGQVKAKVKVILDPKEVQTLNGEILVTSSTDPGWVTLFPTASAILVERGSLLSHSAIVSRELGIPCVVGVTGLLKRVKTGDVILLDGSTGEIKIIEDE